MPKKMVDAHCVLDPTWVVWPSPFFASSEFFGRVLGPYFVRQVLLATGPTPTAFLLLYVIHACYLTNAYCYLTLASVPRHITPPDLIASLSSSRFSCISSWGKLHSATHSCRS